MYTCISVYMYSLTHYFHACFKHRLFRQNHNCKSVGFIRFVLVYTAKVLNLYLGLIYTTLNKRPGNIVGTSLPQFLISRLSTCSTIRCP